jgi:hypothetical protein
MKDAQSADRSKHILPRAEARQADLLPVTAKREA